MLAYIDFWRHYADFSGKTSRRNFWMALFIHIMLSFCLDVLACIVLILLGFNVEEAARWVKILVGLYGLVWIVPFAAMMARRLRDAGYSCKSFFWLLIPGIGGIAVLVRLAGRSRPASDN